MKDYYSRHLETLLSLIHPNINNISSYRTKIKEFIDVIFENTDKSIKTIEDSNNLLEKLIETINKLFKLEVSIPIKGSSSYNELVIRFFNVIINFDSEIDTNSSPLLTVTVGGENAMEFMHYANNVYNQTLQTLRNSNNQLKKYDALIKLHNESEPRMASLSPQELKNPFISGINIDFDIPEVFEDYNLRLNYTVKAVSAMIRHLCEPKSYYDETKSINESRPLRNVFGKYSELIAWLLAFYPLVKYSVPVPGILAISDNNAIVTDPLRNSSYDRANYYIQNQITFDKYEMHLQKLFKVWGLELEPTPFKDSFFSGLKHSHETYLQYDRDNQNNFLLAYAALISEEPILNLARFTSDKMFLHYLVVHLITKYQIPEDEGKTLKQYVESFIKILVTDANAVQSLATAWEALTAQVNSQVNDLINEKENPLITKDIIKKREQIKQNAEKLREQISQAISFGTLSPQFKTEEILATAEKEFYFRKLLRNASKIFISSFTEKFIDTHKSKINGLEPLLIKDHSSRTAILIAGGPASGKGNIRRLEVVKKMMPSNSPFCVLNPDDYKPIVMLGTGVKLDDPSYANLTHQESSYVTTLIMEELENMLAKNQAPDFMLDMVKPSAAKLNLLLKSKNTHVLVASVTPELAVERAFARYRKTGREVPPHVVLNGHAEASKIIPDILEQFPNATLTFYDTTNNPTMIAERQTGQALIIHDITLFLSFIEKSLINQKAFSPLIIYWPENPSIKPMIDDFNKLFFMPERNHPGYYAFTPYIKKLIAIEFKALIEDMLIDYLALIELITEHNKVIDFKYLELALRLLRSFEQALPNEHQFKKSAQVDLAICYMLLGKDEEAKQYFDYSIESGDNVASLLIYAHYLSRLDIERAKNLLMRASFSHLSNEEHLVFGITYANYFRNSLVKLLENSENGKPIRPSLIKYYEIIKQELSVLHTFTFYQKNVKTIHLVGNFNNWLGADKGKIKQDYPEWKMKEVEQDLWQITVSLLAGKYEFKYVINGERWENDNTYSQSKDQHENINSVLILHANTSTEGIIKSPLQAENMSPKSQPNRLSNLISKFSPIHSPDQNGIILNEPYASDAVNTTKLQQLIQRSAIKQLNNGVKIIFQETQDVNAFRDELFKIGLGNPGMKDAPKKIQVLPSDMENNQELYAINLTNDEWKALCSNSYGRHPLQESITQFKKQPG